MQMRKEQPRWFGSTCLSWILPSVRTSAPQKTARTWKDQTFHSISPFQADTHWPSLHFSSCKHKWNKIDIFFNRLCAEFKRSFEFYPGHRPAKTIWMLNSVPRPNSGVVKNTGMNLFTALKGSVWFALINKEDEYDDDTKTIWNYLKLF